MPILKIKNSDNTWQEVFGGTGGGGGTDCIPSYTEADYGKVLSVTSSGLVWIEQNGGSGGTVEELPSALEVGF